MLMDDPNVQILISLRFVHFRFSVFFFFVFFPHFRVALKLLEEIIIFKGIFKSQKKKKQKKLHFRHRKSRHIACHSFLLKVLNVGEKKIVANYLHKFGI